MLLVHVGLYYGRDFIVCGWCKNYYGQYGWRFLRNFGPFVYAADRFKDCMYTLNEQWLQVYADIFDYRDVYTLDERSQRFVLATRKDILKARKDEWTPNEQMLMM